MDDTTKQFVEEQIEKLAGMVAQGFAATGKEIGELRQEVATNILRLETSIERLEGKVDAGFDKQLQEIDQLRDRMRVLETRIDHAGIPH